MKPLYDNLSEPQPLAEGALRIIPLGGLGEVGRNMNVLELAGKLLVVDCGVLFPEETQPDDDMEFAARDEESLTEYGHNPLGFTAGMKFKGED